MFCHSELDSESIQIRVKTYYVYILASKKNGTLYTGVTSNLTKRVYDHKQKIIEGFTKRYDVTHLVYFAETNNIKEAILKEKQIKNWKRTWKIDLIEKNNPNWKDLYNDLIDSGSSPE